MTKIYTNNDAFFLLWYSHEEEEEFEEIDTSDINKPKMDNVSLKGVKKQVSLVFYVIKLMIKSSTNIDFVL